MLQLRSQRVALVLVVAGLALVLAAQAIGGHVQVGVGAAATGESVGKAGFAYLTGFRTTIASLLWKSVDEQGDAYYAGADLGDQKYLVPTVRLINWLVPGWEEPYYVAQWVIARQGKPAIALEMTAEGLANNPESGLLRYSYAQLLDLFFNHDPSAYQWALKTVAADTKWRNVSEKLTGWAIARDIFKRHGDTARYEAAARMFRELQKPDAKLSPSEIAPAGP